MKKVFCSMAVLLIVSLSGCSVQELMNPRIFLQRLKENYREITLVNDDIYCENEKYFCFLTDSNNKEYALQFVTDSKNNIKKICLVCKKENKTDEIKFVSEAIINTYAPNEDAEMITANLFENDWDYYNSQWYRYTSSTVGDNLFFSVENIKLSTNTDAELTLKPNDVTTP